MWFTNIFSKSVACFFIHLIGSFTIQKFLILRKSNVSIPPFMDVFGIKSRAY